MRWSEIYCSIAALCYDGGIKSSSEDETVMIFNFFLLHLKALLNVCGLWPMTHAVEPVWWLENDIWELKLNDNSFYSLWAHLWEIAKYFEVWKSKKSCFDLWIKGVTLWKTFLGNVRFFWKNSWNFIFIEGSLFKELNNLNLTFI
jgi:hypothetical protein